MSLEGAHHIVINGGTFVHSKRSISGSGECLSLFSANIAPGALHNSAERFNPPRCHVNTRKAILETIIKWFDNPATWAQILWVYGSAGVGKSAIAQTVSEMCFEQGRLAASFFFSRGVPNRHTETLFVATLAYQLMKFLPEIRDFLLDTVANDPTIFSLSLESQMKHLIINPINFTALDEVKGASLRGRASSLIVVDGLDECDSFAEEHRHILNLLFSLMTQLSIPISIIVSCRPEQLIREAFGAEPLSLFTTRINLDNFTDDTDIDIRTFLLWEFQNIKSSHPAGANLPSSWPSEDVMTKLMLRARGHFIYAYTVVKYIGSRRHSPTARLSYIIQQSIPSPDAPFAALDSLYHHILLGISNIEVVFKILVVLLVANQTTCPPTVSAIERMFSFEPGTVNIALCDLHSVIYVPREPDESLRIYHASFSDFLFDETRSGVFFMDPATAQALLASVSFGVPITRISPMDIISPCVFAYMDVNYIQRYPRKPSVVPISWKRGNQKEMLGIKDTVWSNAIWLSEPVLESSDSPPQHSTPESAGEYGSHQSLRLLDHCVFRWFREKLKHLRRIAK